MKADEFDRFLCSLGKLSKRQRDKVALLLAEGSATEQVVVAIERAASKHLACPRCRSLELHLHGQVDGLQRYRCVPCGRTFSALTGTPLARLRYKSKWLTYLDCLLESRTVRKSASYAGMHKDTSFRGRHRFLTLPKIDRP